MITLSPSSISDFKKCPLMFWLGYHHKLGVPRGAFPSLPGGMDRVLKTYYDEHRLAGTLPQEIIGKVPTGFLLYKDQAQLKKWRYYKTGLGFELGAGRVVRGAFDDLLHNPETNLYAIPDYKTRGAAPKEGGTEEYYQVQGDCYSFSLNVNGFETINKAFFIYYWPAKAEEAQGKNIVFLDGLVAFKFQVQVVAIETDDERAKELAVKAFECLEGPMPGLAPGDEVSDWLIAVIEQLGYRKLADQAKEIPA